MYSLENSKNNAMEGLEEGRAGQAGHTRCGIQHTPNPGGYEEDADDVREQGH